MSAKIMRCGLLEFLYIFCEYTMLCFNNKFRCSKKTIFFTQSVILVGGVYLVVVATSQFLSDRYLPYLLSVLGFKKKISQKCFHSRGFSCR